MPVPWLAIMAGAQLAKGAYDWYSAGEQKKKSQKNLKQLGGSYMKKSPEETQFLAMLQRRMEKGALPVNAMMSGISADIGEHGGEARQRALGFAASRGMENTGVAASMANKADANTVQAIARTARAIAIQNEMSKTDAERELGQYGTGQSDIMRQAAMLQFQGKEGIADRYSGQMSDAVGGLTSAVGTYAGGKMGVLPGQQGQQDQQKMIMNFLGGAEDQEGFDYRLEMLRMLYPNLFPGGSGAKPQPMAINPSASMA